MFSVIITSDAGTSAPTPQADTFDLFFFLVASISQQFVGFYCPNKTCTYL